MYTCVSKSRRGRTQENLFPSIAARPIPINWQDYKVFCTSLLVSSKLGNKEIFLVQAFIFIQNPWLLFL